ncbi:hypothetical protein BANRA_03277 [Acinetobacter baumannii]|nr:hypothetical protein BANRA_03277 [Acinetobacter baumannii]
MALSAWGFTDLPSYTDKYDPNEKDIVIKTNNWLNDEAAEEKLSKVLLPL